MKKAHAWRPRAVLFDKDGTLFDFKSQWMPAYHAATTHVSGNVPDVAQRLLKIGGYDAATDTLDPRSPLACGTTEHIGQIWADAVGRPGDRGIVDAVAAIFHDYASRAPQPVTDLRALFSRLRARGLAVGVATTDATGTAERNLATAGVTDLVDFVAGWDRGFGIKPDPGLVHAFGAAVAVSPGEIVVIGDSVLDLTMGRNAGAGLVVGVLTGVTPRELLAPLADHVLDSIATIETVLPA
jgi:phosphoglycolate phosphatase